MNMRDEDLHSIQDLKYFAFVNELLQKMYRTLHFCLEATLMNGYSRVVAILLLQEVEGIILTDDLTLSV